MAEIIDSDTFPYAVETAPDCCQPHGCVCPDGEPCHFDALERIVPKVRPEVEMPRRG